MKLKPQDVARFVAKPDPKAPACLIFGTDPGLVRERSNQLAAHTLGNLKDNFGLIDLTEADIKADPARLSDEICSISMLSEGRVVRVQGAGETTAKIMTGLLEDLENGAFKPEAKIIIEAGDLAPRSKLRKLFEADKTCPALVCYVDEGRNLETVILSTLSKANLEVDPPALSLMMEVLGADRALTRAELEKLLLYKGVFSPHYKSGRVKLDDVLASMGAASGTSVDGVVDAALSGNFDRLDKELQIATAENIHPTVILRGLQSHLGRLINVRTQIETGGNLRTLMKSLRPPVFFKREQAFAGQAQRWPSGALKSALNLTLEAEINCKKTGEPDTEICAHALMSIASRSRRLTR
jgi:DNA polymerase III subunit delta